MHVGDTTDGQPVSINVRVPNSARMWNYWLGGKDHYEIDRLVAEKILKVFPQIVAIANASRTFQFRAVHFLTREAGVRQFLDIGSGLPTTSNTHEAVQSIAPEAGLSTWITTIWCWPTHTPC